jgi:hypothetical protein
MAPFQNCVRWSRLPTKMAAKLKIEKRGYEILIVHCCFSISHNELSSFWFIIKQQRTIEEMSIFSNSSHLEWRAGQSDKILKGTLKEKSSVVNISHFNLLLRNHWANCNQILVEWSLDGPLPKLCPVINHHNFYKKSTYLYLKVTSKLGPGWRNELGRWI